MLLSIVVPVYNGDKYISECLDSILNQSFADFEVILINDGSTDNSGAICDSYAHRDNRFRVIHKKNEGPVVARRIGSQKTTGQYIICLDADDTIESDYFLTIANSIFDYNPDMICLDYKTDCGAYVSNKLKQGIHSNKEVLKKILIDSDNIFPNRGCLLYSLWSKIVKREIFCDAISIVPEYLFYGEDIYQIILMLKKSPQILILDKAFYLYRTNAQSITRTYDENNINNYNILCDELYSIADTNKVNSFALLAYYECLSKIAKNARSYFEYKKVVSMKYLKKLANYSKKADLKRVTFKFYVRKISNKIPSSLLAYIFNKYIAN